METLWLNLLFTLFLGAIDSAKREGLPVVMLKLDLGSLSVESVLLTALTCVKEEHVIFMRQKLCKIFRRVGCKT